MRMILFFILVLSAWSTHVLARPNWQQRSNLSPELAELIVAKARNYGIDPLLLLEIARQESGFRTRARSSAGALGLMQFIPITAARFSVADPFDAKQAIDGGCRYILYLMKRFDGRLDLVLAGYNAGEEAVEKYGRRIPPYRETILYVRSILIAYYRARQIAEAAERGEIVQYRLMPLTNAEIRKRMEVLDRELCRPPRSREMHNVFNIQKPGHRTLS